MSDTSETKLLLKVGLNRYQAAVLVVLADNPASNYNSSLLALESGVPRTSVYQNCDALVALCLIMELDDSPRLWRGYDWPQTLPKLRQMCHKTLSAMFDSIDDLGNRKGVYL